MIDEHAKRAFDEQGYVVARALFETAETAFWRDYFTHLREAGGYPDVERGAGAGACGEWLERDGRAVIELTGVAVDPRTTE